MGGTDLNKLKELDDNVRLSKYIACICEGKAEKAIMELLLENNKLKFDCDKLLEGELIVKRSGKNFEECYLRKGYTEQITILRILDSRSEANHFKLSKAYEGKVKVINIITAPEIEMLIIHNENKYSEFNKKKSEMKVSEYCKKCLKMKNVKSYDFVKEYFKDTDSLITAITEYNRTANIRKDEYTLFDLLK